MSGSGRSLPLNAPGSGSPSWSASSPTLAGAGGTQAAAGRVAFTIANMRHNIAPLSRVAWDPREARNNYPRPTLSYGKNLPPQTHLAPSQLEIQHSQEAESG